MLIVIALVCSTKNNIPSVRILDTINNTIKDVKITDKSKLANVRNIRAKDNGILCLEGVITDYPTITHTGVQNNIPVYIEAIGNNVKIANYAGRIVSVDINQLRTQISSFANANWNNDTIQISSVQSELNTKLNTGIQADPFESLMSVPDVDIDIHNFNMRQHYKKMHVPDETYKDPYSIFVLGEQDRSREAILSDTSAYKLVIVKVDNRVELRDYIGNDYEGEVIVPPEVTHICAEAFSGAKAKRVVMSDNVIYLGEKAFYCSSVEEVKLSSNITAIPLACFRKSNLRSINLEHITSIDNLAFCESKIREVILKAPVIQIGFSAFEDCMDLEKFEHAGTIKKIRHDAFKNCILLNYFDFSSVITLEQYAFYNTGITEAKLNGEINYLQSGTITGKIEQVEILEGMTKISANAVSNTDNKPITWTMPKSAQNLEKGVFTSQDTVMCYRGTVSVTQALIDEAQIVYLDELDRKAIPSIIKKANMINASIEDILRDTLSKIIDKGEFETDYNYDDSKVVRQDIPKEILDIISGKFRTGLYATDSDIENESIKFKAILDHLSKVGRLDITPFSSMLLNMKSTFRVFIKNNNTSQVLYDDGISSVHRIRYIDNKYTSIDGEFIVAKTRDTLRYICMDNRYTDIMCENPEIHDLTKLLNILRPGDTIGLNCVISGTKYPEISTKSNKKIQVTNNGVKTKQNLTMNIYQALRYSSITLKLDANTIVLIIPGNKKIIKCASLGKSVWQNEKEETYKSLQCTIVSIEDIGSDTIFDYDSTYSAGNYGQLFKRLRSIPQNEVSKYIESYSHIFKAEQSMYKHAGDYAHIKNMSDIEDLDMNFMLKLFNTSLFEERQSNWLSGSIGKTIVADAEFQFKLSDGSILRQYRTVKKTALRNKLMSGGDRKLYIFELLDKFGMQCGIYISLYNIRTLVDMCIGINTFAKGKDKDVLEADDNKIFINKDKFDVVGFNNVIEIAQLCRDSKLHIKNIAASFIFAVYKPNGLYYIGLKIEYGKTFRFIPVMQIGELDVALGFIEESNKSGTGSEAMKYLSVGAAGIISNQYSQSIGRVYYNRVEKEFLGLLKAREMCIDGISDIKQYNTIGIPEILKRCLGYNTDIKSLYAGPTLPSESKIGYSEDIDFGDLGDLGDLGIEDNTGIKSEQDGIGTDNISLSDAELEALRITQQLQEAELNIDDADFGDI